MCCSMSTVSAMCSGMQEVHSLIGQLWDPGLGWGCQALPSPRNNTHLKHHLNVGVLGLQQLPPGGQVAVGEDPSRLQQAEGMVLQWGWRGAGSALSSHLTPLQALFSLQSQTLPQPSAPSCCSPTKVLPMPPSCWGL